MNITFNSELCLKIITEFNTYDSKYCCVLLRLRLKSLKSVTDPFYNLYLLIITEEWNNESDCIVLCSHHLLLRVHLWKLFFSQWWCQNIYPLAHTYACSQMLVLFSVSLSQLDDKLKMYSTFREREVIGEAERSFDHVHFLPTIQTKTFFRNKWQWPYCPGKIPHIPLWY